ncbi:MAG TPA: hypothetical protein VHI52_02325 [Verrucomicrobiae bacterium]|nr:hypothetical protein [Verrucomicrobiae bacterium]
MRIHFSPEGRVVKKTQTEGDSGHATPVVCALPWDFKTSFPWPTSEVVFPDIGLDVDPQGVVRELHDLFAQRALAALSAMEQLAVTKETTAAGSDNEEFAKQRKILEGILQAYSSQFGSEVTEVFRKAIETWHQGGTIVRNPIAGNAPPTEAAHNTIV